MEERKILHTTKGGKTNWIGHIFRMNYFRKHVIVGKTEGRIEVTRRRERRGKQLLDDWREDEKEGVSSYWMTDEKTRKKG
jgi:hypothetical protein